MNPRRSDLLRAGHILEPLGTLEMTQRWARSSAHGLAYPAWYKAWSCALIISRDTHMAESGEARRECERRRLP